MATRTLPMFPLGTVLFPHPRGEPLRRRPLRALGPRHESVLQGEWLPDDPYPLARVEVVEEIAAGPADVGARADLELELRRVLAMLSELGVAVPTPDLRLDDDPVRAAFEACAVAPVGPLDAQRILEIDEPSLRLVQLLALLAETATLLELRLAEG